MRFIIRSVRQLKLSQELYRLGLFVLVTALIWIGFDLYRAYTTAKIPKVLQEQLQPLNPSIDVDQLNQLQRRLSPSQTELNNFVPLLPIGQEVELVIIPATESGTLSQPEESPAATISGQPTTGG